MLMDVSKEHRLQGPMGTQQLLKTSLIEEPDRIHAGITDGDRWMVKGDHQGQITELKNPHRSQGWTASRCSSGLDP